MKLLRQHTGMLPRLVCGSAWLAGGCNEMKLLRQHTGTHTRTQAHTHSLTHKCTNKQHTFPQGVVGTPPSPKDLAAALQSHAMFVYFGHGSGEQYMPLAALRRLHHCAANLLMGCSSGKLRLHGGYDPAGAVWALLLAGEGI